MHLKYDNAAVLLTSCFVGAFQALKFDDDVQSTKIENAIQKTLDDFDSYYLQKQDYFTKSAESPHNAVMTQCISSTVSPLYDFAENE